MAKKKQSPEVSTTSSIIEGAKKYVIGIIRKILEEKTRQIEEWGMKIALGVVLFFVSVFFILTGIVFALHDNYQWSLAQGFLVMGLIALAGCLIVYFRLHSKQ